MSTELRSFLNTAAQQQQSIQELPVETSTGTTLIESVGKGGVPMWQSPLMNYHMKNWMFQVCTGIEPFINGSF
jgi:hypothetical protein